MRLRLHVLAAASLLGLGFAPQAVACVNLAVTVYVPDPPPGLSPDKAEQWRKDEEGKARLENYKAIDEGRRARQTQLWDEADVVFVARVERKITVARPRLEGSKIMTQQEGSYLVPVRWLKGQGEATTFQLANMSSSDCGADPGWSAISGPVGTEHVIFVRGGAPSQETVQDTISAQGVVLEPRIRAALGLRPEDLPYQNAPQ